jgi:hypothetical protein
MCPSGLSDAMGTRQRSGTAQGAEPVAHDASGDARSERSGAPATAAPTTTRTEKAPDGAATPKRKNSSRTGRAIQVPVTWRCSNCDVGMSSPPEEGIDLCDDCDADPSGWSFSG